MNNNFLNTYNILKIILINDHKNLNITLIIIVKIIFVDYYIHVLYFY